MRNDDADPEALQRALDALAAPAEPLDVVMTDGFVCALQLHPQPLPASQWQRWVLDIEGRMVTGPAADAARSLLQSRADALHRAIAQRRWFDPWIFELVDDERLERDEGGALADALMPWAAGFALGIERFGLSFPGPRQAADEPLALIYRFLDADDWPDVAAIGAAIDELEPPETLDDAVEDLVRAVLLLADLTGPHPSGHRSAASVPVRSKPKSGPR